MAEDDIISTLAEIRDLQRQQLELYKETLVNQQESLKNQRESIDRQKQIGLAGRQFHKYRLIISAVIFGIILFWIVPATVFFFLYFAHHP